MIESRLTPLVERFSSSGVEQMKGSRMTYHWSYEASLGALKFDDSGASSRPAQESHVAVSGDLVIDTQNGFELSQKSRLTQSAGTQTLSSLFKRPMAPAENNAESLLVRARQAAKRAHCPYSNFHVGAAVR